MRVWLQLVDRAGERLQEECVDLSADAQIDDLQNALTDKLKKTSVFPTKFVSRHLEGVVASALEVYEKWGESPLDLKMKIGASGALLDHVLLVKTPKVWFRLVDRAGERLNEGWVNLSTGAQIADSQNALTDPTKLISRHLEGVVASALEVYEKLGENPLDKNVEIGSKGALKHASLVKIPKVWYRLVDRNGKRLQDGWVNLSTGAKVVELQKAFTDPRVSISSHLEGLAGPDLAVYDKWGEDPLDEDVQIGSLGASLERALLVEIPRVWYQLFAAGTRKPMTGPTFDPLSAFTLVQSLQIAAKTKYERTHLKGVEALELKVYKNWDEEALQVNAVIGGHGKTAATPLIVEVPQNHEILGLSIDKGHAGAVKQFTELAKILCRSQEVNDVLSVVKRVCNSSGITRFIVLENSSGTGKMQMAFNLQATQNCDVFYVLCTKPGGWDQEIYQAFETRTSTFVKTITKDMQVLKTGSVGEFTSTITPLHVYAFIVAALRGDTNCSGTATRKDAKEAFKLRKQATSNPFVFFLDEYPRVGPENEVIKREATRRSMVMRNAFRSLKIPVILSATNGTARTLVFHGDRSRQSSIFSHKAPWYVMIPSLSSTIMNGSGHPVTSVADSTNDYIPTHLRWILQHSRPFFAKEALAYVRDHAEGGEGPADSIDYLSDITAYLAPHIRRLRKETAGRVRARASKHAHRRCDLD